MGFADDSAELQDAARSWRRVRRRRFTGELESLSAWKVSKKNFSKVLDGDAKADQNLASLLLTTKRNADVDGGEGGVEKRCEKKFSKMLDSKANGELESRLFADNNKLSATQEEE